MNNSNLWYTEKNVLDLFGYSTKSSAYSIRGKVKTRKISNRYLYLRQDVNALLNERFTTQSEKDLLDVVKKSIVNYDIDLTEWIPLKEALEIVPFSRQRLYQIIDRLQIQVYDGFRLFNKEELNAIAGK